MLVLPATSMHLHPPFPVSILPTGASTNGLVQPLSSEKEKKIVHTNPLILQILLNQCAVVSLILLTPFPPRIMAILIPKS